MRQISIKYYRRWIISFLAISAVCLSALALWVVSHQERQSPSETAPHTAPLSYGRELLHAGKYSEAEEEFKKALRNDPADVKALSALGTLYYRQGKTQLAYQYWTDALKIAPNEPTLQGLVKALEKDRLKPGPLYHMKMDMADQVPSWERHFVKGQDLYLEGDYPQAVQELKEAVRLNSGDSKIYFILGAAYLKTNQRDEVIQAWEKALKLNPEDQMVKELLEKVKSRDK